MDGVRAQLTPRRVGVALASVLASACDVGRAPERGGAGAVAAVAAVAADSQYTPAAMIARFRRTVPARPTQLGGGATTSADSLLARWVRGVEARDTSALASLALTVGEFAWLYYLDSPMARPPYELDPETLWMQTSSRSARGLARTLARYGGRPLGAWRPSCEPPRASGALRLHVCHVVLPPGGSADPRIPLSVVERDGRFKLVGLATDL